MTYRIALSTTLTLTLGCADVDPLPADQVPPAGVHGMTASGPLTATPGDLITIRVTSPELDERDIVDLGWGTELAPGRCPYRGRTGGSLCIDITRAGGESAVYLGGSPAQGPGRPFNTSFFEVEVPQTPVDTIYLQGFLAKGPDSATSQPLAIDIVRPDPTIFVTANDYLPGTDFVGREGADALCQAEADAAGLPTTSDEWYALLGRNNFTGPSGRGHIVDGLVHTRQREVVEGGVYTWGETLDRQIRDPFGELPPSTARVHTGSDADGSREDDSGPAHTMCDNWSSSSPSLLVMEGHPLAVDDRWLALEGAGPSTTTCATPRRLYCVHGIACTYPGTPGPNLTCISR